MKLNTLLFASLIGGSVAAYAATPAPVKEVTSSNNPTPATSLEKRLQTLEVMLKARNRAQIDMQRQVEELQDELNELRGLNELHNHRIEQLLQRQRELYQELDRVASQRKSAPATPAAPVTTPTITSDSQAVYTANVSENDAYEHAVNLILKEKQYDRAIPEFERFIQNFPDSVYIPNAHYWIGQLLFNDGKYTKAKEHFSQVVKFFPDSPKRSDAMFKLGTVFLKLNQKAEAKRVFDKVIKEYPSSTSAKLARSRLDGL